MMSETIAKVPLLVKSDIYRIPLRATIVRAMGGRVLEGPDQG